MRISSFTVYGSMSGSIILDLENNTHMTFDFSEEESARLRAVAQQIVEERQSKLADAVSQPFPALADFTEC